MKQIINSILDAWSSDEDVMLVTIIDRAGSTPRGIGASMLVSKSGLVTGTVGGGQVEKDAIDLGIKSLLSRESFTKHFELNLQDTSLNMVCGGNLYLHFLYMDKALFEDAVRTIDSRIKSEENGFIILDTTNNSLSYSEDVVVSDGIVSIPIPVPDRVIIFGGGHVSQALTNVLSTVGFSCIVVENRKEFTDKSFFPMAKDVIYSEYETVEEYINFRPQDYIVIMTHGHSFDYVVLEKMLRMDQTYIGVMGSRRKREFINEKLRLAGISEDKINSVHAPIGINIGSITPEEVAISVAAEMIKVRAQSRGDTAEKKCPSDM